MVTSRAITSTHPSSPMPIIQPIIPSIIPSIIMARSLTSVGFDPECLWNVPVTAVEWRRP
jgi:hypothetical protein